MSALGWLRPAKTEVPQTAIKAGGKLPVETITCAHAGCQDQQGWRCSYKDPTKAQCRTAWCREHVVMVDGAPFCRRHAEVVRILKGSLGTLAEIPTRPLLEDRTLGIINRVRNELDAEFTGLLRECYRDNPAAICGPDASVRAVFSKEGGLIWETGWAAYTVEGYLSRLTLRVRDGEPPRVELKGDGDVIFVGVPDFIAARHPEWVEKHPEAADFHAGAVEGVRSWLNAYPPEGEYRPPASFAKAVDDPVWAPAEAPAPARPRRRR